MTMVLVLHILSGALLATLATGLCVLPMLGILQQENYAGKRLFKWFYRAQNMLLKRVALLSLCLVLLCALTCLCFSFLGAPLAGVISAIPFVGICIVYLYAGKKYALKVPVTFTNRMVRLSTCFAVLLFAAYFGAGLALEAAAQAIGVEMVMLFRFVPMLLMPLLFPCLLFVANFVMKGYELPRNARFVRRAKAMLSNSDCIKVGITGSCGKTSVKFFAEKLLEEKYRVIATPASYNTPLGIARTVCEKGLDCDVFLAEMGARKKGDISELCEMVTPLIGVVTTVNSQHLLSFGSIEAIAQEKGQLIAHTKRNLAGMGAASLAKEGTMVEGKDFAVEGLTCTAEGSQFTLRLPDGTVTIKTSLLGKHAAHNIALAAALCAMLGMSKEEIAAAVERLQPVPHRLQLIAQDEKFILDDSYNSNVDGAKNAVETLRLFAGNKFVVTPGLVELGELEEEENANLGASLVGLDGVILVGETLVLSVRAGYLAAGGDEEKLTVVPTLEAASKLLGERMGKGDCALFLNDLPDCYL